ncbi:MAG: efflux RND transporter periplasmic adaptor subunit [Desulfofustis sp.]|nr:efflux RND transporter periplasmic adaptor subunit [Desulfofustis sp.]
MIKKIVRIIILLLVISAGTFGYLQWQNNREAEENGPLKIYGSIDVRDAALAFAEQERIAEILVEEGQKVETGQLLARQRTDLLEATIAELEARIAAQQETVNRLVAGNRPQEIEQARAEVEAARVRTDNVRQVLQRLEKTSGSGATSLQDLDDAKSKLKVELALLKVREKALNLVLEGSRQEDIAAAKHQLEAMQANLAQLNIRLRDMNLRSPSPGIVQSRNLEVGELAGPSKPVLTLALIDPKWVRAYVPEPMLGKINLGMKAQVISDSYPDQPIPGWVGYISPVAEFTPRTVATEDLRTKLVYEARVYVEDKQDRLRLGMPVTVTID